MTSVESDTEALSYEEECMRREIPAIQKIFQKVSSKYSKQKEDMIAAIEEQCNEITEELDRYETESVEKIERAYEKIKAKREGRQNNRDIYQGYSIQGLTEGLLGQISEDTEPDTHTKVTIDRPVFEGNPDIEEGYRFLRKPSFVEESRVFIAPWKVRSPSVNIGKVMSEVGECVQTVGLQSHPYRLAVVNGTLWIGSNVSTTGSYEVYDFTRKRVKPRFCDTLQGVRSFCQTTKDEVIAACDNGLYVITTWGAVEYMISGGRFTDVCAAGGRLVAVGGDKCRVFEMSGGRWKKKKRFGVKRGIFIKTLHVVDDKIYVGNWGTHTVSVYSIQGDHLGDYGVTEGTELGQFSLPFVSGTDDTEALFVCDMNNHRVQVADREGAWREYTLSQVRWPRDILVLGDWMCVLWGKRLKRKLSVYAIP